MVALFGLGGLALAFLPFEERPLETWLVSFIKSIYGPTIYTYQRIATGGSWVDDQLGLANLPENDEEDENPKEKKESDGLPSVKIKIGKKKKNSAKQNKAEKKDSVGREKKEEEKKDEKVRNEAVEKMSEDWKNKRVDLNLEKEKLSATGEAKFGEIPMPDRPEVANLIVGMVTDKEGKIVDGAIVEIQDGKGNPVRVLKTNLLGQFRSSTALADGTYLIIPEKEGYKFDRINIELVGKIVAPVKIQAIA